MKLLAGVVLCAGCNQLFGLSHTTQVLPDVLFPDGTPDAPDGDMDGVPDAIDNCLVISNPDQSDVDQDGYGDLCDNCPVIANPHQENVGDGDEVGDACDFYPSAPTPDCLVLFDSFHDGMTLASGWDVSVKTGTPNIDTSKPSHMIVTPPPNDSYGVVLTSTLAASSRYNVELIGTMTLSTGSKLVIASNHTLSQAGYSCDIEPDPTSGENVRIADGTSPDSTAPMSSPPVNGRFVLRLQTPPSGPVQTTRMACRADHGVAIGFVQMPNPAIDVGGAAAFNIQGSVAEIDAIAVYQIGAGTCPTPIYR